MKIFITHKYTLLLLLIVATFPLFAQQDSLNALQEIRNFRDELNREYTDTSKSPLTAKDLKNFRGHNFFPVQLKYRVMASLELTENEPFSRMKTTSGQTRMYRKYAVASFTIDSVVYKLNLYQSQALMNKEEYKDYLFLPFADSTNGEESYGGGRYIDLKIPKDLKSAIIIDFNQAYNPYCAYNHDYSCPLVPPENQLGVVIPAGVRRP